MQEMIQALLKELPSQKASGSSSELLSLRELTLEGEEEDDA
jgi:hypothetical protein